MKRRVKFVIEAYIVDLDDEEREELLEQDDEFDDTEDLAIPDLKSYIDEEDSIEREVGWLVANYLDPDLCREMFAGSNVYVTVENGQLISAEWVGDLIEG